MWTYYIKNEEDAKRVSVDKETELEGIQDFAPLSKVEIQADIAHLQKSERGCPLLKVLLEVICIADGSSRASVLSTLWSLEVVSSRRLPMYYRYGIFNP